MSVQHCLLTIALVLAITESGVAQSTMQPWLTRSADNSRSGWNPNETELTQTSVITKGIIRATIIPLVGDARGMEAQRTHPAECAHWPRKPRRNGASVHGERGARS